MSTETSGYRRFSATAPGDFLDEVTAEIPKGKFSAWVFEAMREKRERDNLAALVAEMDDAHGPADDTAVARAAELLG
ncbi:hypothetical protein Sked_37270 [Sanguibacter keddieii DSM 10542]|uniref:Uncharacterized protein n=1 Tax=Sanguibacter keddieii (strain ATCC 51767 / DSM 10542 / NCFB 3025 / ST-74) TaxID=446469 RepID=D1BG93_SANKS|nr:hypothetical protein [Sanguibacter keddieii]ACZ23610.1 hypothetical protein Sked_37270 [Sanguibacter keddieii DSM 10542]